MATYAQTSASERPKPPQGIPGTQPSLLERVADVLGDPTIGYLPMVGGITGPTGKAWEAMRQAYMNQARSLPGRAALPTMQNLGSMTGGMNVPGNPTMSGMRQLAGNPETAHVADQFMRSIPPQEFGRMIGPTRTGSFLRPDVKNVGGMVPSREAFEGAMNNGLRDIFLNLP